MRWVVVTPNDGSYWESGPGPVYGPFATKREAEDVAGIAREAKSAAEVCELREVDAGRDDALSALHYLQQWAQKGEVPGPIEERLQALAVRKILGVLVPEK